MASGGVELPFAGAAPGRTGPAKGPARGAAKPAPAAAPVNPLLNPNASLSGNALYAAAQALAKAQTQPALTALAQQIAQQNTQTQNAENLTGGYFNQLGQQVQQGVADEKQISDALNQKLADLASQEQGQIQGIGQNATNTLNSYLPASDRSVGQAGQAALTAENARQQGLAAQQEGAARALGAQLGGNYQGLAASQLGTFGLKGQEDLKQIAQAGQVKVAPLNQKIGQLQQTYGADLTTALGKLRQQQVANNEAAQALGIKQQAANTAANTAAFNTNPNAPGSPANARVTSGRVAQQNANTNATRVSDQAKQNQFNDNPNAVGSPAWRRVQQSQGTSWSQNPNAVGSPAWARVQKQTAASTPGGVRKPLSTVENNHFWATIGQIEQLIRDGQANGQQGKIDGYLQNGQNPSKKSFDPFMISVANQLLGYNGRINQSTAAILHNQYGVRGGTYNGQPITVTPDYKPNPAGGAAQVLGSLSGLF